MKIRRLKKKAVSPIIATVLLIMIVIILAIIILLWTKGFTKEAIEKEIADSTKNVENWCREVSISGIVNNDAEESFGFRNDGSVPIYAFNLELSGAGGSSSDKINTPVNPSSPFMIEGRGSYSDYDKVKIIPILLGKSKSGVTQEFECSDKYGVEI